MGDSCLSWFVTNQFGNHVFRSDQLFPDLLHWRKFQLLHDLQMFHCVPLPDDSLSSPYDIYSTFYFDMSSQEFLNGFRRIFENEQSEHRESEKFVQTHPGEMLREAIYLPDYGLTVSTFAKALRVSR